MPASSQPSAEIGMRIEPDDVQRTETMKRGHYRVRNRMIAAQHDFEEPLLPRRTGKPQIPAVKREIKPVENVRTAFRPFVLKQSVDTLWIFDVFQIRAKVRFYLAPLRILVHNELRRAGSYRHMAERLNKMLEAPPSLTCGPFFSQKPLIAQG